MKYRFISLAFLLSALLLCSLIPASASKVLTEGVSILNPKANMSGDGYDWANRTSTLTLNNLHIETEDSYGLKICHGATVILKGKNYIEASKAALYLEGDVIFRGNGSLTLVGGEVGLLCHSTKFTDKLSINGGTFTITGGVDGIRSPYQKIALAAANITIYGGDGYAINARDLSVASEATLTVKGSLYSSYSMILQSSNLSIESSKSALIADNTLRLEYMTLSAGDSLTSVSAVEQYNGEKALKTSSTFDSSIKSILFGKTVPIAVDILLLVGFVAALSAVIAIPIVVKRRKATAVIAARDAAEAEQKRLRKEAKKASKT